MLFFGVVIFAGESFKILGVNASGLVLLIILWQLRHNLETAFRYIWLVAIFLVFVSLGIVRYRIGDVIEDAVPFVVFLVMATALTVLQPKERVAVCKFVIIASALALLKVLAINYLDITPQWAGDTFWQGTKSPVTAGVNRVVLKGADVFIGTSTVVLLCNVTLRQGVPRFFKGRLNLVLLVALIISVVFSLTRGTVVAIAAAMMICIVFGIRSGLVRPASPAIIVVLLGALIVGGPLAPGASAYYERFLDTAGEHASADDAAFAYRYVETIHVIEAAQQTDYLGAGLGASYWTPLSGSDKDDGRSLFAHSLPAWLLLKVGVIGVCIFYIMMLHRISIPIRKLVSKKDSSRYGLSLMLTTVGALLYLLSNDVMNNKFATLSGAAAYALYFVLADYRALTERQVPEDACVHPINRH